MAHKAKKHPEHWNDLRNVVTVPEAAKLAGVNRLTIRWHVDSNNLVAFQCGVIWLVSRRSLSALYPHVPPNNDIYP